MILNMRRYIFIMFMEKDKFKKGRMATVIGILKINIRIKKLTVVRPGSQSRKIYTHR